MPLVSSSATCGGGSCAGAAGGGRGRGRACRAAELRVVGGDVGDVLVGEAAGDRAHRRVLALALAVGGERAGDVLGVLAGDHRHLVDLGEARLVARQVVAALAHGDLLLAGGDVARLGVLRAGGDAEAQRQGDEGVRERQDEQLLHGCVGQLWRRAQTANYRGALILNRPCCRSALHEVQRLRNLRRHARPDAGGERGGDAQAPAAGQGRARHRQDDAGRGSRHRARHAADAVAHQVDHQGAAGPLRVRRRQPPARQPARRRRRRRARQEHPQLHRPAASSGRPSPPSSRSCC